MTDEPSNHLTAATLEMYFAAGHVIPLQLSTTPDCRLRIDPPAQTLELWTPADGPEPDVTALSRLSLSAEEMDDGPWFVLTVDARGLHYEAYSLIAAIVDDLTTGQRFVTATTRSLTAYRDLLSGRGRLSEEKTLGLIGELLVLDYLISEIGESSAVTSWLGPASEEHDFVLVDMDAEVKTTLSEKRTHVIGNDTQLLASPSRPLWLVSIQLTRAGDAAQGFALADVIGRVRTQLSSSGDIFSAHLRRLGWRDQDVDLYRERYLYRTRPAAYRVDDDFPALTRPRIDVVVPRPDLVSAISYRVNVSSLVRGLPPGALAGFVESDRA